MVDTTSQKRVTILGATGSVGASTIDVIKGAPERYRVEAVTANTNGTGLAEIARATGARAAAVSDPAAYADLRNGLAGTDIEASAGEAAVIEAAERPVDMVVAAIVGAAGLAPTFAALRRGGNIALANKECMVSAGGLFMKTVAEAGGRLLPVDSEHNAIFQVLDGRPRTDVERIILTASGGPFLSWDREAIARAGPSDALKHPNWSMGAKITIDSATMMNKGLEIIEAHHLFEAPARQLDVIVHPESIVHGLVEFADGGQIAALGHPDMRVPVSQCLAWPERPDSGFQRLDLAELGKLTFLPLDEERFPAFKAAMTALHVGGWATNILSAANEIAVGAFLAGRIGFLEIAGLAEDVVDRAQRDSGLRDPQTIAEAIELDGLGRRLAKDMVEARAA